MAEPKKRKIDPSNGGGTTEAGDRLGAWLTTLNEAYGMPFPAEIGRVWALACEEKSKDPLTAFDSLGVRLVGPFEFLHGKLDSASVHLHMQWRFKFDPPETLTVLTDSSTNRPSKHWCYHRDDPAKLPSMITSGTLESYTHHLEAPSLLAFLWQLSAAKKNAKLEALFAEAAKKEGVNLSSAAATKKARDKAVVATTMNRLGLVVPYNKETEVGYRECALSDAEMKSLISKMNAGTASDADLDSFDDVSRFVDIANDEGDYGHGLEVGTNYFCLAKPNTRPHNEAKRVLKVAYMLLSRPICEEVIQLHMDYRNNPSNPPVCRNYKKPAPSP
ncbi:UPF0609 protein [Diplonema papillatum]|nr:UPF0609 protein [Diplonema papillatum]